MKNMERRRLIIQGQVQGVGFRPYVWHIAHNVGLTGFCQNTSAGVVIEIQGKNEIIEQFQLLLQENLPPLAIIHSINANAIPLVPSENSFVISHSESHASQSILVAPDAGICDECINDIRDPRNPRYDYPFTNCVNCGPRFSITRQLPYDRPNTVMNCFPMCRYCASEYSNPSNRRFHAQPIACQECGPKLLFMDANQAVCGTFSSEATPDALDKAARLITNGKIIALKGIGGFQLACDACNEAAVSRLRLLKHRPHKAFAVMTDSLATAHKYTDLSSFQTCLLTGREKPIVLARKRANSGLSASIAPDSSFTGLMLPCSPLHVLLFDALIRYGISDPCLVMTSGNLAGEPICLGNREALKKLAGLADGFILHNRDILCRVDDSVVLTTENPWRKETEGGSPAASCIPLRRARGYVPVPVLSPFTTSQSILGCGAELKNTFSLTRQNHVFTSQHIGDLKSLETLKFYREALEHLTNLLETAPSLIIHDLHPDFISTSFAREYSAKFSVPAIALQHHAAHAAAVLAENGIIEKALVIALDGSGLGEDGTIWGGEFIEICIGNATWKRRGSFESLDLPGGEMAIREPWRIMRGIDQGFAPAGKPAHAINAIDQLLKRKLNTPASSSCGRYFDAMSARLGICEEITYEGQAAIKLETAARKWAETHKTASLPIFPSEAEKKDELYILSVKKLVRNIGELFDSTGDAELAAATFHWNLAKAIADMAVSLASELKIAHIGLAGGVCQNMTLLHPLYRHLTKAGFSCHFHQKLPPGDGSISYGQAVWGQSLISAGKI